MKKLFALVALVLGVVSCQTDPNDLDVVVGGEREVMLNVSLPEATRSASNAGFDFTNFESNEDYDLRYILEIRYNGHVSRTVKTAESTSVSFPVRLAPGREYDFTVWADLVLEGSEDDLCYNTNVDGAGLTNITIKEWTPNNELRDAYYGKATLTEEQSITNLGTIELTRPFAKVRVVATDIEDVLKFGIEPDNAIVTYTVGLPTTFNAVSGTVAGSATTISPIAYNIVADAYTENTNELTVFADYIFVPENGTISFNLNVKDGDDIIKENNFSTAIPVVKNKLTTIKGAVLTEGGDVSIKIENGLGELETINLVDTAADLQEIINNTADGESANITLGGDIVLGVSASTSSTRAATRDYIYIAEGKTVVLDLTGFNISHSDVENKYAFNNHGTLIIKDSKGGGSINARGIYNGYGEGAENVTTAKIIVESGVINAKGTNGGAAIFNYGVAEVKGGKFESNGGYGLNNQSGASMTITGGEIRGGIYNCGTLSVDGENTSVYQHISGRHAIYNYAATAIINNGAFDSESGNELILADGENSSVTINGGTFDKTAKSWLMGAAQGKNITFVINGGTFRGYVNQPEMTVDSFRPYGDPIVVYGGNFNFNPTQWLSDDYTAVETENGLWTIERRADVVKIGEVGYTSLQKAVAEAQNGDTVLFIADVEQEDGVIITDKNITIDLNGNTFTVSNGASTNNRNLKVNGSSVVTIKNGTMVAEGDYSSGAYGTLRTEGTANVTLEDVKLYNYRGNGLNVKALSGTTVTINDTEIYSHYGGGIESAGGTIELTNVKVEQEGMYTAPYNSMAISVNGGGTVTVNSGTYSTECITAEEANNQGTSHGPWCAGVLNSGGTLIIKGGTFSNDNFGENALATYARGLLLADTGANIQIEGGTFNAVKSIVDIQNNLGDASRNPSATISGGYFSANPLTWAGLINVAAGYGVVEENGVWTVAKAYDITEGGATIYSAAGMLWFANEVNVNKNAFNGKTVTLANDIDLNNENWAGIGTEEANFCGTFDGCNHTIKNLNILVSEGKEGKAYLGLFGYAKNATIKNVVFENVDINVACLDIDHSQGHIGAVAGSLEGTSTIENVTVQGDVKVYSTQDANGASRVAVVAGGNSYGNVTMKNVHVVANEGSYLIANNNTGALAGQLQGKSVFENCSSNIDVTVNKFFAGGIIGLAAGDQTFTNCHTTGNIAVVAGREGRAHDQYRVGGIAGGWSDGKNNVCTLVHCSYTGNVSGKNSDGSVANPLDYMGYVGRGYTLNGCQGSTVNIDGVRYVQKYDTAAEAGIYDVYDVDGNLIIIDGVVQTSEGNYLISKAAGLTWFSDQMNNKKNTFAGKTITIVNDIDMAGVTYYGGSIASYPSYCFKGTFDGGEKVISNLTITVENDIHGAAALIPTLAGDGTTIKNVILRDVNISSSHYAAGIWGYTTSDNCYINVTNCRVEGGTITGNIYNGDNADKVGGIGGIFYTGVVSGCSVKNVTITGYRDTAGIVGWAANANATIKNNSIENVTINVNNATNYKNYTKRSQYDVNSFVGEGVGTAKLEGNTGEATINWGSIAE